MQPTSLLPVVLLAEFHVPEEGGKQKEVVTQLAFRGYNALVLEISAEFQPRLTQYLDSEQTPADLDRFIGTCFKGLAAHLAENPSPKKREAALNKIHSDPWGQQLFKFIELSTHAHDLGYEVLWVDVLPDSADPKDVKEATRRNESHVKAILDARKRGKNILSIQGLAHLIQDDSWHVVTTQQMLEKEGVPYFTFHLDPCTEGEEHVELQIGPVATAEMIDQAVMKHSLPKKKDYFTRIEDSLRRGSEFLPPKDQAEIDRQP